MAQYKTGTVSVTNGSQTVTGAGTLWLTNITLGNLFKISSENVIYNVASIVSDTQITLSANYTGTTQTGVAYQIVRDFTPTCSFPEIHSGDLDWPIHLTDTIRKIDTKVSGPYAYTEKTAAYTLTSADSIIVCPSGTFTLTLPAVANVSSSTLIKQYTIKNTGVGVITIDGAGAETIDGVATKALYTNDAIIITGNGATWLSMGFVDANLSTLSTPGTANQIVGTNAGATDYEHKTLNGTTNRVTVTHGVGSVTWNLPQDIHTGASPTFAGATLSGLTAGSIPFAGAGGLISQDNANFYWDNINKRLGIGTASPISRLDIRGEVSIQAADVAAASFVDTINGYAGTVGVAAHVVGGSPNGFLGLRGNLGISLFEGTTEVVRIDGGNVGIGMTTPGTNKLHIYSGASGGTAYTPGGLVVENSSRAAIQLLAPNNADSNLYFGNADSSTGGFVGVFGPSMSPANLMIFQTYNGGNFSFNLGNVGIGTTGPTVKLDVRGDDYRLSNNSVTKEFSVSFPNTVANQKVDFYMTGTQALLGARIEVTVTDYYNYQNATGLIKKVYGVGLYPAGAIYANEARYTEVLGTTADNWALSDLSWDATNARYKITLVHRVSTANSPRISIKVFGAVSSDIDNAATFTVGSIYTTDTTVYGRPYEHFNGNVGIGTTAPSAKLDIFGGSAATSLRIGNNAGTGDSKLDFYGVNGVASPIYANVGMEVIGGSVGDETGSLYFSTISAGSFSRKVTILGNGNVGIGTTDQFGSGSRVIGLADATTLPTTNPTGGLVQYSNSGNPYFRTSAGTVIGLNQGLLTSDNVMFGKIGAGVAPTYQLNVKQAVPTDIYTVKIDPNGNSALGGGGLFVNGQFNGSAASQVGISSIVQAAATSTQLMGMICSVSTAAAAITLDYAYGLYVGSPGKGAGSTITNAYGILINPVTVGTTNYAIYTNTGAVRFGDIVTFAGTNSTGAGSAALGANSPAITPTAPYTWITVKTADGSTGYIPVWK